MVILAYFSLCENNNEVFVQDSESAAKTSVGDLVVKCRLRWFHLVVSISQSSVSLQGCCPQDGDQ